MRSMIRILPLLPLLPLWLILTSCQITPVETAEQHERVIELIAQAVVDIKAARRNALAHNDRNAVICYDVLLSHASDLPDKINNDIVGPVSTFQEARNIRRLVDRGIDEEIHSACASLVLDARTTVLRVMTLIRVGAL